MSKEELVGTVNLDTIKKRAVKGVMSLTLRRVLLQAISFVSINIILARIISPAVLGIFNISTAVIAFFAYFSDVGLAAALIQKKDTPTREDLVTTFSIQQILVGSLSIIIYLLAERVAKWYGLDNSGMWLIRVLAISFFLSSLKVVPSVLLERGLRFDLLIIPEIVETLSFNIVLIILTYKGFSVWSFVYASLVRGITGTILIYLIAPWRIGFGIKKEAAKELMSFGIPFQLNSFLALLKDRVVPLFVAKVVGATAIGYITWAQAIAFLPLEVMNIIIRVTFPVYSRLQSDKETLKAAIEKSLFMISLFLYPSLFGLMAIMPKIIEHVVNPRWAPALPSFYLFCFSTFWAAISTTFTNALNATGNIKVTLRLMVFWTVLTWILTPILVLWLGFIGVGLTSALISFTSILTVIEIKKVVDVSVTKSIWRPIVAAGFMAVIVYLVSERMVFGFRDLSLVIIGGAVLYLAAIFALYGRKIISDFKLIFSAMR